MSIYLKLIFWFSFSSLSISKNNSGLNLKIFAIIFDGTFSISFLYFKTSLLYLILELNIIKMLIAIKDENKWNYYINLCLENNLSRRELERNIENKGGNKWIIMMK